MKYSIDCLSSMLTRFRLQFHLVTTLLVFSGLAFSSNGHAAEAGIPSSRPTYLGLALAYPAETMNLGRRAPILAVPYDSLAWLTLEVGTDSAAVVVAADTSSDSTVGLHFSQFLDGLRFVPAELNGVLVASRLRLHVRFRANGLSPMVVWPIGEDGVVNDQTLYSHSLRLNGVEPPRVKTFPAYHGAVRRKDSLGIYPFVLTRVDLDSAGAPTSIVPVRSTYAGFDALVHTACNWASYEPARIAGKAVPASVFVLVSFFPNVSYPTRSLDLTGDDTLPLLEMTRVRLLCDTLGPLSPALPRFIADDSLLMEGNPGIANGDGTVLCLIDSLGNARAGRIAAPGHLQRRFQRLVAQLEFFPALDREGRPMNSMEPLGIRFSGSAYVRIDVLWLPANNPQLQ